MSSPAPALDAPPPHRFARGFLLPWTLLSTLRRDGDAWRRYRRVLSRHLVGLAVLGAFFSLFVSDIVLSFRSFAELASWKRIAALVSSLYGVLVFADAVVTTIGREYLDDVARTVARVAGVDPDRALGPPGPRAPRLRFDLGTPWRQLKLRLRGLVRVAICAAPWLAAAALIPRIAGWAESLVFGAWGAYWFCVGTAGKSAGVWLDATAAPTPGPVALWERLAARSRWFRWWLPRLYLRLLRRSVDDLRGPVAALRSAPWTYGGLALARALCGIPGLYSLVRPLLPAAATLVASEMRAPPSGT